MRSALTVAVLLILVPPITAQDATGDVEFSVGLIADGAERSWLPFPEGTAYQDVDITDATVVSDSPEEVRFRASVVDRDESSTLPGRSPSGNFNGDPIDGRYQLDFSVHDARYSIEWRDSSYNGGGPSVAATLYQQFPTGQSEILRFTGDATNNEWNFDVPRNLLVGLNGGILLAGDEIVLHRMASLFEFGGQCNPLVAEPVEVTQLEYCGYGFRDQYPDFDEDATIETYVVKSQAPYVYDNALIDSPAPVQVTNGGQTFFLFQIRIMNLGEDRLFGLELAQIPPDWTVESASSIWIPGGQTRYLPVFVQVPFGHAHGTTTSFGAKVTSGEALLHELPLAISWMAPPQPAGHHSRLYVHEGMHQGEHVWMDTLAEHENGTKGTLGSFSQSTPMAANQGVRAQFFYPDIPLVPGLLMGLDADLTRNGALTLSLESRYDVEAVVQGTIHYKPNAMTGEIPLDLFTLPETVIQLSPNGRFTAIVPVIPNPEADYLRVTRPGELSLAFEIEYLLGPNEIIEGLTGQGDLEVYADDTFLDLPLHDFQFQPVLMAEDRFSVTPTGPTLRKANPGDSVVFDFHLESLGSTRTVAATVLPQASFDARLSKDANVALPNELSIRLDVPNDALEGTWLTAVIDIADESDATSHVLALVSVEVTSEEIDDDSERAQQEFAESKKSSGLSVIAMTVLLACVPILRRR